MSAAEVVEELVHDGELTEWQREQALALDERRRTAWHESGHAVASFLLRGSMRGPLSIRGGEFFNGIAFTGVEAASHAEVQRAIAGLADSPIAWFLPARVRRELEAVIMVFLAGQVAQAQRPPVLESELPTAPPASPPPLPPRPSDPAAWPRLPAGEASALAEAHRKPQRCDLEQAYDWAVALVGGQENRCDLLIRHLHEETRALMAWPPAPRLVRALATRLLEAETLSGREVRAVLKGAA